MEANTQDGVGIKLGMWLFLYTEIMLFGGLFVLYAAYYTRYTEAFISAGQELDWVLGAANTIILLVSSFTVAAAITAVRRNARGRALGFVGAAILMGLLFLVNKYFEWGHKFDVGIYPGSTSLAAAPQGQAVFFGLYYTVTGLHGLHIIIGLALLGFSFVFIARKRITADRYALLENAGLYWHLVDLIWIFIFPLFYLIL